MGAKGVSMGQIRKQPIGTRKENATKRTSWLFENKSQSTFPYYATAIYMYGLCRRTLIRTI